MALKSAIFVNLCIILVVKCTKNTVSEPVTCKTITNSNLCIEWGYKFYLFNYVEKLNWFEAQRFCRRHNASLVTIEDSAEWDRMSNLLKSRRADIDWFKGGPAFFTSGFDLGSQPGTFFSVGSGNFLPFTAWFTGEPNNEANQEHCVIIWYTDRLKFRMNDTSCFTKHYFICEMMKRVAGPLREGVCEI